METFSAIFQAVWKQHRELLRLSSPTSWCLWLGFVLIMALFLDQPVIYWVHLMPEWVYRLGHFLEIFGDSYYPIVGAAGLTIGLVMLAYSFPPGDKRQLYWAFAQLTTFISLATLFSGLVVAIVKRIIGRPRPIKWLEESMYDWLPLQFQHLHVSMPSGHTTTLFTLAFILCALFPKSRWTILGIAGFTASGRVMMLSHWPSDVVIGAIVGWGLARLAANLLVGPTMILMKKNDGDFIASPIWHAQTQRLKEIIFQR